MDDNFNTKESISYKSDGISGEFTFKFDVTLDDLLQFVIMPLLISKGFTNEHVKESMIENFVDQMPSLNRIRAIEKKLDALYTFLDNDENNLSEDYKSGCNLILDAIYSILNDEDYE